MRCHSPQLQAPCVSLPVSNACETQHRHQLSAPLRRQPTRCRDESRPGEQRPVCTIPSLRPPSSFASSLCRAFLPPSGVRLPSQSGFNVGMCGCQHDVGTYRSRASSVPGVHDASAIPPSMLPRVTEAPSPSLRLVWPRNVGTDRRRASSVPSQHHPPVRPSLHAVFPSRQSRAFHPPDIVRVPAMRRCGDVSTPGERLLSGRAQVVTPA